MDTDKQTDSLGVTNISSSSIRSISSHSIVSSTMKDLFRVQQDSLARVRSTAEQQRIASVRRSVYEQAQNDLAMEKMEHSKTKLLLQKETEKLEFINGENEILKQQMLKEQENYETSIKHLRAKASRESKRCDFLQEKYVETEKLLEKQDLQLREKDNEIRALKEQLRVQRDTHKMTLKEIDINKMQQEYMAKTLEKHK